MAGTSPAMTPEWCFDMTGTRASNEIRSVEKRVGEIPRLRGLHQCGSASACQSRRARATLDCCEGAEHRTRTARQGMDIARRQSFYDADADRSSAGSSRAGSETRG